MLRIRLKLFTIIILIAAAMIVACQKIEPTLEEKRAIATNTIGIAASLAASLHVEATRACEIAGIKEIEACALHKGTLLPEREAKSMAIISIENTKHYFEKCLADFSADYCNDLIARAIEMEQRKTPESASIKLQDER